MLRSLVGSEMCIRDSYISGKLTTSLEIAQNQYREKLLTLDDTGFCFNYYAIDSEDLSKPITCEELNISDDSIVFISGANFFKVIPETKEAWAKILVSVENSVLVLYPFSGWNNSYPVNAFLQQFYQVLESNNIDKNRLVILPQISNRSQVKEYLKIADVYLDAIPYSCLLYTSPSPRDS